MLGSLVMLEENHRWKIPPVDDPSVIDKMTPDELNPPALPAPTEPNEEPEQESKNESFEIAEIKAISLMQEMDLG